MIASQSQKESQSKSVAIKDSQGRGGKDQDPCQDLPTVRYQILSLGCLLLRGGCLAAIRIIAIGMVGPRQGLQIKSGTKEFPSAATNHQRTGQVMVFHAIQELVEALQQRNRKDIGLVRGARQGQEADVADPFELDLFFFS